MARHELLDEERRRMALERLMDSLENGEIDAVEDLSAEEVALLMSRARPGESLGDLFDRVRQPARGRE